MLLSSLSSLAQTVSSDITKSSPEFAYRLYPTQNMWTFIKLDTRCGKMWQVQFSVEGSEYRFESNLSDVDLTELTGGDTVNGRFELYPTQNTYNFILLDRVIGNTYQVQWSIEPENRGIMVIGVNGN